MGFMASLVFSRPTEPETSPVSCGGWNESRGFSFLMAFFLSNSASLKIHQASQATTERLDFNRLILAREI